MPQNFQLNKEKESEASYNTNRYTQSLFGDLRYFYKQLKEY